MSNKLYVLPLSVHDAAAGLAKVAQEVAGDVPIQLTLGANIQTIDVNVSGTGTAIQTDAKLTRFLEDTKSRPELPCASATLKTTTTNQQNQPNFLLHYRDENGVTFFFIEQVNTRDTAIRLIDSLRQHFKLMTRAGVLGASMPADVRETIRFREDTVSDLAAQVSRLGVFLTGMAEKNTEVVRSLTSDLEKQFQQKQSDLDARIRRQQEELDAERREFEKVKAAFDDRQRTHVRRDLLTKIQENIDKRAAASPIGKGAQQSRWLIHGISVLFMLASAIGGYLAGVELYRAIGHAPFDWRVVPPFSLAALLFGATVVFYFRWISRWSDRLSSNDLDVQQYKSDILRASWIVELLFEYKDEKGKEIPGEVMAGVIEGLFKREPFHGTHYHPSDDLAALMRRFQSLKAGPQGVEVMWNDGRKR